MFNYKSFKKAEETPEIEEKMLTEVHEDPDGLESTQKRLEDNRHNADYDTTENQLEDVRYDEDDIQTIEAQMDDQDTDETPVRNGLDKHDQLPINLLAEAEENKKVKAFNKAYVDGDTAFWDKYVGEQLLGEHTKVPLAKGHTQINNIAERFENLNFKDVSKNKNVKEMIMASLKDADAMLYHIYRSAANRQLTLDEQNIIEGINSDKIRVLAQELTPHQMSDLEHAAEGGQFPGQDNQHIPPLHQPQHTHIPKRNEKGLFDSYAWPGGYPIYYVMADGESLCPDCANGKNGSLANENSEHEQWKIIGQDINWEDDSMICAHCNKKIDSAYGEPDENAAIDQRAQNRAELDDAQITLDSNKLDRSIHNPPHRNV